MNSIRRLLPSNLSIGSGFIVRTSSRPPRNGEICISKQIDIIIYDNRTPVLFFEGDFVITTQNNVKAIIEVKTKIRNNQIKSILSNCIYNAKIVQRNIFCGIFAYDYSYSTVSLDTLKEKLETLGENGNYVNHLSLGSSIFVKYWKAAKHEGVDSRGCDSDFYGIYDFASIKDNSKKLSFSYFISNIVYSTSIGRQNDRLWFLFPASGGKELYRVGTACLQPLPANAQNL